MRNKKLKKQLLPISLAAAIIVSSMTQPTFSNAKTMVVSNGKCSVAVKKSSIHVVKGKKKAIKVYRRYTKVNGKKVKIRKKTFKLAKKKYKSILSVSKKGVVTGKKKGTGKVKVKIWYQIGKKKKTKTYNVKVTVKNPVKKQPNVNITITNIDNSVHDNTYNNEDSKNNESSLLNYRQDGFVIEDGVLKSYTGDLKDLVIPNGVIEIDDRALSGCEFTTVTIPSTVNKIGNYAFYNCVNLIELTIPDSVSWIGNKAFAHCTSLIKLIVNNLDGSIGKDIINGDINLMDTNVPGLLPDASTPTADPTETEKPVPTEEPTETAKPIPTEEPTETEEPTPTIEPTEEPTTEPTPVPTAEPTKEPVNPDTCDHSFTTTETKTPTCTEEGSVKKVCSICGLEQNEIVPKTDHDWVKGNTVDPTKKTEGYTEYICQVCGETEKRDIVPATGIISDEKDVPSHEDGSAHEWVMTGKEYSTCDADENDVTKTTYTCSVCKNEKHEESVDFGHGDIKDGFAFDADGNLWYYENGVCEDCNEIISTTSSTNGYKGVLIKDYDYSGDYEKKWSNLSLSVYSFPAINKIVLSEFTAQNLAYGPDWPLVSKDRYDSTFCNIVKNICSKEGSGGVYVFDNGTRLIDNWVSSITGNDTDIFQDFCEGGIHQCIMTGILNEIPIDCPSAIYGKNGHVCNFTTRVLIDPICHDGSVEYFCPECYHKEIRTTHAKHDYENGTCIRCGEEEVLVSGIYDTNDELLMTMEELETAGWVSTSSLTADGTWTALTTKSSLHSVLLSNDMLDKATKIVFCDDMVTSSGELKIGPYCLAETNITEIVLPNVKTFKENAFSGSSLSKIVFDETVDSVTYTTFKDNSSIKNITFMGDSVSIGFNVFRNCTSLQSVIFSGSTVSILSNAFMGCTSLNSVIFPNKVTLQKDAFNGCVNLTDISTLPFDTVIPYNAFSGSGVYSEDGLFIRNNILINVDPSLSGTVVIPESVIEIGNSAFSLCREITSVVLPSSLKKIGDNAFSACIKLADISGFRDDIIVDIAAFPVYKMPWLMTMADKAENGMFIHNNCLYAISSSLSSSVTVPEGVVAIGKSVFNSRSDITSVTLPSTLRIIGGSAFSNSGVEDLIVPDTVERIDTFAFENVKHVTYHGSATGNWYQKSLN